MKSTIAAPKTIYLAPNIGCQSSLVIAWRRPYGAMHSMRLFVVDVIITNDLEDSTARIEAEDRSTFARRQEPRAGVSEHMRGAGVRKKSVPSHMMCVSLDPMCKKVQMDEPVADGDPVSLKTGF